MLESELKRIHLGQFRGKLPGQVFSRFAAGSKQKNRPHSGSQRSGDQLRPMPSDLATAKGFPQECFGKNFLQRNGTPEFRNKDDVTPMSRKPVRDLPWVRYTSAHQKQTDPVGSQRQSHLVSGPSLFVSQQLIFIHHQKIGGEIFGHRTSLRFKRCHDDPGIYPVA